MKRREIISLLGGAGMWPLSAGAQQKDLPLIGILMLATPQDNGAQEALVAFFKGLDVLGWKTGRTIRIEVRWGAGQVANLERYAAELVALRPDVILANGTPAVVAFKKATESIPIVFAMSRNPVELGHVRSLARPGGNITGFTYVTTELIGKWWSLLTLAAPSTKKAGLFYHPTINPQYLQDLRNLRSILPSAIDIVASPVESIDALHAAMADLGRTKGGAGIVAADAFMFAHGKETAALALQYRLPTISVFLTYVGEGGLMAYGPDTNEIFRRSASYVDRILKGEKAADLPVQQPEKFGFGINLRAAKALGLTVSPSLFALADEVVE
ncbi:MAG: ABC transporter substrate-binding protein [Alphaproteobacteria bacterium]|nr:ABC transporter substrate-binding protein [Alphaproteobacteria bacterium]MCW5739910.1 ABC transporter substrate-binding protein [Alphaproteobacteria bacterium]